MVGGVGHLQRQGGAGFGALLTVHREHDDGKEHDYREQHGAEVHI